ncbi:MAG: NTP transferase domain-containing protein [Bacteroidia bacterium]
MQHTAILMLAGGQSSRMKFPKAFLQTKGQFFANKIHDVYHGNGFSCIYLILNSVYCRPEWDSYFRDLSPSIQIISNDYPEKGRLFSIQCGLREAGAASFFFIHNIDNPFVSTEVVKQLWENRNSHAVILPSVEGKGGHPVLIPAAFKGDILHTEAETLKEVISNLPRIYVDVADPCILQNINTPEDYIHSTLSMS